MISICAWVLGIVVGFVLAAVASISIDRKAVEQGVVKLDGKVYRLSEIK